MARYLAEMAQTSPDDVPASAPPSERAGMSLAQYDWHVRDMAKSLLHAAGLYVVLQAIALTRLIPHFVFREPGGWWREIAVFLCGFLGAWAVMASTLLRDAGLRSWTVTILVPLTVVAVVLLFVAFPPTAQMSRAQVALAAALVSGPGPVAWLITMRRWRVEKRRAAALLRTETAS